MLRGIANIRRDVPNARKRPVLDADVCRMVDALDIIDLELRDEGLLVTVRHSKTDQADSGQTIAVPAQVDSPYCPVAAVEHWSVAAGVRAGAVFRRFFRGDVPSSHRLSAQSVAAITMGRDSATLSGHSLRHGFLTQAARNGSDIYRVAAQSRHRDVRTVMSYVQDKIRFDDHPGQRMLRARGTIVPRDTDARAVHRDDAFHQSAAGKETE